MSLSEPYLSAMSKPPPRSAPSRWKGNKASLPSKPCAVCGRTMTWRRAWARNWNEVLYCSDACRKQRPRSSGEHHEMRAQRDSTGTTRSDSNGRNRKINGRNNEC